ncbi:hypothetical protein BH10ACT11_BH10ACT11_12230 [soil metagenome]
MALKVIQNEVDGWDIIREDEGVALSNHPTRESAEEAAAIRADEDRINDAGDAEVVVDTEHVHEIDDTREGVRPALLYGGALMAVVILLIVILAVTGSLTGFGS